MPAATSALDLRFRLRKTPPRLIAVPERVPAQAFNTNLLDFSSTDSAGVGRMVPELPSQAMGAGDFKHTASLIPLPADLHCTLRGEEVNMVLASSMVLCGVYES
jgi:hypothetical protein